MAPPLYPKMTSTSSSARTCRTVSAPDSTFPASGWTGGSARRGAAAGCFPVAFDCGALDIDGSFIGDSSSPGAVYTPDRPLLPFVLAKWLSGPAEDLQPFGLGVSDLVAFDAALAVDQHEGRGPTHPVLDEGAAVPYTH